MCLCTYIYIYIYIYIYMFYLKLAYVLRQNPDARAGVVLGV